LSSTLNEQQAQYVRTGRIDRLRFLKSAPVITRNPQKNEPLAFFRFHPGGVAVPDDEHAPFGITSH
jgi:hypothetical protein